MPRLFTGLSLPATHLTALGMLQSGLREARWIEPSDMHITLRFIGDVSPQLADAIAEALTRTDYPAPEIRLTGLDAFGTAKPRSIYAAVGADGALSRLQAGQERLMQQLGLPPEGRKFTPHVTLARGRGWNATDVHTWLAQRSLLQLPAFTPTRFHLYSARESTGGGPYVIEESYPLSP